MTPPIDPVERESIERDAETVRGAIYAGRGIESEHAPEYMKRFTREANAAHDALDRILAELTLEKQRGEGLRAALEEIETHGREQAGWMLDTLGNARAASELLDLVQIAREALRISQGDSK